MRFSSGGNDPLLSIERYTRTHTSSSDVPGGPGKINVSITCSRNQQQLLPCLLTKHQHTTTTFSLTEMEKRKSTAPPTRERERDYSTLTYEEDLPLNSQTSISAATYRIISREQNAEHCRKPDTTNSLSISEVAKPKSSHPFKMYISNHIGPSIAPAAVRAVATHRLRPITNNTMIKGKKIVVMR